MVMPFDFAIWDTFDLAIWHAFDLAIWQRWWNGIEMFLLMWCESMELVGVIEMLVAFLMGLL